MPTGLTSKTSSQSPDAVACAAGGRRIGRTPNLSLLTPGTAVITHDGMLLLAGADLDYAGLDTCSARINALTRTLTLKHGPTHFITPLQHHGMVEAFRELAALGVNLNNPHLLKQHPARVVRHSDGHTRWLTVRFDPALFKGRARKNKSTQIDRMEAD